MDSDPGSAPPAPGSPQAAPGDLAPGSPPPGWYPDPYQPGVLRFWDGRGWGSVAQAPVPLARPSKAGHALSVWALVLGVVGVTVPAFICGALAINRLAPGERSRRTIAWLGIAFSAAWVVGGVAYLVTRPAASTSGTFSSGQLSVGQCVEVPSPLPTTRPQFDARACDASHNGEVMNVGRVADATYPGEDQIAAEVKSMCRADLFAYVGATQSSLHYVSLYPDSTDWAAGSRLYVCLAVDRNGDVTTTMKGSKL